MPLYVGLMSGTSMDGIDAILMDIAADAMTVRAAVQRAWPTALVERLRRAVSAPDQVGLDELGMLDTAVGRELTAAARAVLEHAGVDARQVRAIGTHGQTIRHRPDGALPFTLQLGDPNLLAEGLGIDVVADFRRRDIAAGGQGAPLAPAFHAAAFGSTAEARAIVNVGGIANITLLGRNGSVHGFDAGPGNCLMDAWSRTRAGQPFDRDGAWAATGTSNAPLLAHWLAEPYFSRPAPKSTGRELFSDAWLARGVEGTALAPADVQATLLELTVTAITDAVRNSSAHLAVARVVVCGGGAFNGRLMHRLAASLGGMPVHTSSTFGIAPDHVEGAAFAWLAHRHVIGLAGNCPSVTGAQHAVPLGALYPGRLP